MNAYATERIDAADVKTAAIGRWPVILSAVGGIDGAMLDGRHHPCPRCAGTDRFRMIDAEAGALLCNQCFFESNGDGLSAVMWLTDCSFPEAVRAVATHLGLSTNGKSNGKPTDIVAVIARRKRIPIDAFRQFGAHPDKRGKLDVCRVPMYGPDGQQCSHFDLATSDDKWLKGMALKGKPIGLFLRNGELPKAGESKVLVEGVKDAAALAGEGIDAIGLPSSSLPIKFARLFRDCSLIVIPDRDVPGEQGVQKTGARLAGIAKSVRIATLPTELKATGGDGVREILAKPDGAKLLRQAIEDAVEWQPPTQSDSSPKRIENAVVIKTGNETFTTPLSMERILATVTHAADGWPRRVGSMLFAHDPKQEHVDWLAKTAALFGFLGSKTGVPPRFTKGSALHSRNEVYEELCRCAQNYVAVEESPHEPIMTGHYYACAIPEAGDGHALHWLLNRFSPATPIDRDLIQAMFMSVIWGGPGGCRPAFVLTADAGRGSGKSTLAAMVGYVANGAIELSANEDATVIKQRLLSPEGITKRVAILDNVKTLRFSWAELESMITTPTISGKRMYVGEGQRPNNLTWIITLNGVSLATDMSQRSCVIKLDKPKHSGTWAEETRAYIFEHRREIVADLIAALRVDRFKLERYSRWGDWERDVLSRLPEPTEAQQVILERQAIVDVEADEAELVQDFIKQKLLEFRYDVDADRIFLPSAVLARWYNWATNENHSVIGISRMLKQKIDEGKMPSLSRCGRSYGRGLLWTGENADPATTTRADLQTRILERERK